MFFQNRQSEVVDIIKRYVKEVCELGSSNGYKGCKQEWEAFIDLLTIFSDQNPSQFYSIIFTKCKLAHLLTPMILDRWRHCAKFGIDW